MSVVDSPKVESPEVDRTTLHRVWKAILVGIALLAGYGMLFRAGTPRRVWRASTVTPVCAPGLSGSRPLHPVLICSGHEGI